MDKTQRGFSFSDFYDQRNVQCSIQKSSLATEDCIWFGCNNADPKHLVPGKGWTPVEMPKQYIANTRMHLTREQVKNLLPALQNFVDTGNLE